MLNTPTGQLIIAAAVLDDVIALLLLSELQARLGVRVRLRLRLGVGVRLRLRLRLRLRVRLRLRRGLRLRLRLRRRLRVQPDDTLELEAELELGDLVARDAGGVGGAYARGRAPRDARARHLHVFAGASFGRGRSGRGLAPHCPLRSGVGSGERGGLEFEPAGHRDLARRSPRRCCGRSRPHR